MSLAAVTAEVVLNHLPLLHTRFHSMMRMRKEMEATAVASDASGAAAEPLQPLALGRYKQLQIAKRNFLHSMTAAAAAVAAVVAEVEVEPALLLQYSAGAFAVAAAAAVIQKRRTRLE